MRKILKSFILLATLFGGSFIYNACCETETHFHFDKLEANAYYTDSIIYNAYSIIVSLNVSYDAYEMTYLPMMNVAYADGVRFCPSPDLMNDDPVESVAIYNVLDAKTDITDLLQPTNNKEQSLVELFNQIDDSDLELIFKTPYPEANTYKIQIELTLQSGKVLSDVLPEIKLIHNN